MIKMCGICISAEGKKKEEKELEHRHPRNSHSKEGKQKKTLKRKKSEQGSIIRNMLQRVNSTSSTEGEKEGEEDATAIEMLRKQRSTYRTGRRKCKRNKITKPYNRGDNRKKRSRSEDESNSDSPPITDTDEEMTGNRNEEEIDIEKAKKQNKSGKRRKTSSQLTHRHCWTCQKEIAAEQECHSTINNMRSFHKKCIPTNGTKTKLMSYEERPGEKEQENYELPCDTDQEYEENEIDRAKAAERRHDNNMTNRDVMGGQSDIP